jgi:hypothetical protein
MNMLRSLSLSALMIAAGTSLALAGKKTTKNVTVVDYPSGAFYAEGALGSARASADTTQYIGCKTLAGSGWYQFFCYATKRRGHDALLLER